MSNKHDLPPPEQPDWAHLKSLGYAPGGYMSRCHCCKQVVVGLDKRANTCRPCAEIIYAVRAQFTEHIQRLEAENEALKKDAAAFEWLLNVPASAVHDISLRQWLWKRPWGPDKMRAMIARAMTKEQKT